MMRAAVVVLAFAAVGYTFPQDEWVEAHGVKSFPIALQIPEDHEWNQLMEEWKSDLNEMPQEQLVDAGFWGFRRRKSTTSSKTISMDMDVSAAGGIASGSLCVEASVPSFVSTSLLGAGLKKVFDSMVVQKLAENHA